MKIIFVLSAVIAYVAAGGYGGGSMGGGHGGGGYGGVGGHGGGGGYVGSGGHSGGGGHDDSHDYYAPAFYNFGYDVSDQKSYVNMGQTESRSGDTTKGAYYVHLPDGRLQKTEYFVSGKSGFVPKVSYQQTGAAYGSAGAGYGSGHGGGYGDGGNGGGHGGGGSSGGHGASSGKGY